MTCVTIDEATLIIHVILHKYILPFYTSSISSLLVNTSTNMSSSEKYPSNNTSTRSLQWSQHVLRQLKLLVPGAAMTYYLRTLDEFWDILHGNGGSLAQSVPTFSNLPLILSLPL